MTGDIICAVEFPTRPSTVSDLVLIVCGLVLPWSWLRGCGMFGLVWKLRFFFEIIVAIVVAIVAIGIDEVIGIRTTDPRGVALDRIHQNTPAPVISQTATSYRTGAYRQSRDGKLSIRTLPRSLLDLFVRWIDRMDGCYIFVVAMVTVGSCFYGAAMEDTTVVEVVAMRVNTPGWGSSKKRFAFSSSCDSALTIPNCSQDSLVISNAVLVVAWNAVD